MRIYRWISLALLALGAPALAQQDSTPPLPPITEPATARYLPGKFVWADLFSSNTDASQRFYQQVFGWKWREIKPPPQAYGLFYHNEEPVAGLAYKEAPDGGDSYGRWIHYISVKDVSASEKAIAEHGGRTILSRRSHKDRGEFAILTDAHQVPFGIIRSSSGDPGDYSAAHGEWIWRELFTHDLGAAIRFYTRLFAYESVKDYETPKIVQFLLKSHGHLRAGIGSLSPDSENAPTWLGYVRVDNINATLQRALAQGGKVLFEPQAEIADGDLAIVADPTGAAIGLLHWDYGDVEQQGMRP